jgi:hypothetical protein
MAAVRLGGDDVLLHQELDDVPDEHGQAAEDGEEGQLAHAPHAPVQETREAVAGAGDAGGAQAVLDVAQHLALGEGGERHHDEDEDDHGDGLENGHDAGLEQAEGCVVHRSISPKTTSSVPMVAMTSATRFPSTIMGRA